MGTVMGQDDRRKLAFGERLKATREAAGLTRSDLADRAGVGVRTIEGWEQGRRAPIAFELLNVAVALGVTVEFLIADAPKRRGK